MSVAEEATAAGPAPQAPGTGGRTGVVVAAAVLTEFVVIGLTDNQFVADRIIRARTSSSLTVRVLADSWLSFSWRFAPGSSSTETWSGQLALVLTTLIITGLLVFAVVRGPVTFGRAFVGTGTAVLAATVLGAFLRGLIRTDSMPSANPFVRAAFGPAGPTSSVVFAGVSLGLFVALVTALVAVGTRRAITARGAATQGQGQDATDVAGAAAGSGQPEQPPPYYGAPAPRWSPHGEPTTRLPRVAAGDEATTRFPRPPDDEDLGHVEPHA